MHLGWKRRWRVRLPDRACSSSGGGGTAVSPGTLLPLLLALGLAVSGGVAGDASEGGPARVRLAREGGAWQLLRNGAPFFIKGAVGTQKLELLAAAGGNAVRCGPGALDEVHRAGLVALVGLPLGNVRHGFDYTDQARVGEQFERVRSIVRQYRGHPALLLWNLGNEPEIQTTAEQRVAVWKELNRLAAMVKQEDPDHPVLAVLGDAYRRLLPELGQHCPALDAVGLNSYADMLTLPEDVARQGWHRPYLVTEFGPRGHWQVPRTPWRMPIEDSSTAKAEFYLQAYRHAVTGRSNCLGAFAFYWSHKQEKTHTWYGLFLPDGSRTEAIDVLTFLWSGRWPTNRCPQIEPPGVRRLESASRRGGAGELLMGGQSARFAVRVSDPEGDPIRVTWDLRIDVADNPSVGGDAEAGTPALPRAIAGTEDDGMTVQVALPRKPGPYRLFVYAHDGRGGAATANLPLLVVAPR